jgi:hypothetical protein
MENKCKHLNEEVRNFQPIGGIIERPIYPYSIYKCNHPNIRTDSTCPVSSGTGICLLLGVGAISLEKTSL